LVHSKLKAVLNSFQLLQKPGCISRRIGLQLKAERYSDQWDAERCF